jgi:uncharacterized protein (DUF2147 family)
MCNNAEKVPPIRSNDMKIGRYLAIAPLLGVTITGGALADPGGTWLTQGGTSRIRIDRCGGALCGTIVWLKEPNDRETRRPKTDKNNADAAKRNRRLLGVPIVLGMKPAGGNKWTGQVYNADDGKTYSGNLQEQGPNALRLEGCAMGGLICKGQNWTRAN